MPDAGLRGDRRASAAQVRPRPVEPLGDTVRAGPRHQTSPADDMSSSCSLLPTSVRPSAPRSVRVLAAGSPIAPSARRSHGRGGGGARRGRHRAARRRPHRWPGQGREADQRGCARADQGDQRRHREGVRQAPHDLRACDVARRRRHAEGRGQARRRHQGAGRGARHLREGGQGRPREGDRRGPQHLRAVGRADPVRPAARVAGQRPGGLPDGAGQQGLTPDGPHPRDPRRARRV